MRNSGAALILISISLFFATSSCHYDAASRAEASTVMDETVVDLDGLASVSSSTTSASDTSSSCFSFVKLGDADARAELARFSGLWRDSLNGATLETSNSGEEVPSQEGYMIKPGLISAVSVHVEPRVLSTEEQDPFEIKGASPRATTKEIAVGPMSDDDFRIVQVRFPETGQCRTFAFKLGRLTDGRDALLVRGPVDISADGSIARLLDAGTRAFTR